MSAGEFYQIHPPEALGLGVSRSPVLEMESISKSFQGVAALRDVSFACYAGEVHALVGENGAGKSTLIKILSGVHRPDSGTISLGGRKVSFGHPVEALQAGVSVIYQEFSLLPERTVAQNIFLGRELTRNGMIDTARMRTETRRALDVFEDVHDIDPDTLVADLDVARQQMIEIAKTISLDSKVVVMDEPTAALNEQECETLFRALEELAVRGAAVIYITHRMREVARVADRVTVLKDGEFAASFDAVPSPDAIVRAMVGRDIADFYAPPATKEEIGDVVLAVRQLTGARIHDVSFEARAGEILGFAGLQGAGRVALAMTLYGQLAATGGSVTLDGTSLRLASPRDAIQAGIGLLPGDRKAEALLLMQSVRDNGLLSSRAFTRLATPNRSAARAAMDAILDRMEVRAASYEQEIRFLSGGNQQKAVVARWLALHPRVLIFVEPTRGIDVNAKAGIYRRMRELAREGAAILMISSDLPEIVGAADRVLVMRAGTISAEFPRGAAEHDLMLAATGEAAA